MKRTLLAAVLALAGHAQAQAPSGDAARGQAAWMKNMCHTCHGTVGQGGDRGSGPRVAYDLWPWEGFVQQVRRPRESMPRYPATFTSDQDLADIYAYLATMKRGPRAKDIPLLAAD